MIPITTFGRTIFYKYTHNITSVAPTNGGAQHGLFVVFIDNINKQTSAKSTHNSTRYGVKLGQHIS